MAANLLLRYESIEPFTIKLTDFLSSRGILTGAVTDVIFAAKSKVVDVDVDAVVTKTMGGGGVVFGTDSDGLDTLAVTFDYSDYGPGKLEVGGQYHIGVGFKTSDHTKWLEAKWKGGSPKLKITQDFFRD